MKAHLPEIVGGRIATLVTCHHPTKFDHLQIGATRRGTTWRLNGTGTYVLAGMQADLLLVVARTSAGISLFAIESGAPGIATEPLPTLDLTRKLATLSLTDTPADLVGEDGAAAGTIRRTLDDAVTVLAMEQVGGARRALDMAVSYAKTRYQFGRPIGAFQAIQHKCANMLVEVESAQSAARYALWAATHAPVELALAACVAKSFCSEAYTYVSAENIQVHGGIGFTWEHSAHLYFKRARTDHALFGVPADHRERLIELACL
jgi:alkylation response protein AidB-like acyl-CoA dehydrogenase